MMRRGVIFYDSLKSRVAGMGWDAGKGWDGKGWISDYMVLTEPVD